MSKKRRLEELDSLEELSQDFITRRKKAKLCRPDKKKNLHEFLSVLQQSTSSMLVSLNNLNLHAKMLDAISDANLKHIPVYLHARNEFLSISFESAIKITSRNLNFYNLGIFEHVNVGQCDFHPVPGVLHQFDYEKATKCEDGVLFSSSDWNFDYHVLEPACNMLLGRPTIKNEAFPKNNVLIEQFPRTLNELVSSFLQFPLLNSEIAKIQISMTCRNKKEIETVKHGWRILFNEQHLSALIKSTEEIYHYAPALFTLHFGAKKFSEHSKQVVTIMLTMFLVYLNFFNLSR